MQKWGVKLGIDFGTTRIIVAAADRGNYPILDFEAPEGTCDWLPSLIAVRGGETRFGWDAWRAQSEPDWTMLRSVKRQLEDSGPATRLAVGNHDFLLIDLIGGMTRALYKALRARFGAKEPRWKRCSECPLTRTATSGFSRLRLFRTPDFKCWAC